MLITTWAAPRPEAVGRRDDISRVRKLTLAAGQRLCRQGGRPLCRVYLVRSGILRFERVTTTGERCIVGLAGRRALLGMEAMLGLPSLDEVVACTTVRLFGVACSPDPDTLPLGWLRGRTALLSCHQSLRESRDWGCELTRGGARLRTLRLLNRLVMLAAPAGQHPVIWLPRRDEIAAMLDITLETASRQISALRREGVILTLSPGRATVDLTRLTLTLAAVI
ncbi:Crp/Fnr family transcriptional regulator [Ideonella sp.]|uniref:Crp/Fnr family transcriptional regulator n=1 Tax=Ideonella sp. TaxID=1929293 RepID=UPI003BB58AA1